MLTGAYEQTPGCLGGRRGEPGCRSCLEVGSSLLPLQQHPGRLLWPPPLPEGIQGLGFLKSQEKAAF